MARLTLFLGDWNALRNYTSHPLWPKVSQQTKKAVSQMAVSLLRSPVADSSSAARYLDILDPKTRLEIYKIRSTMRNSISDRVARDVQSICNRNATEPVCRWRRLEDLEKYHGRLRRHLQSQPSSMEAMEPISKLFQSELSKYQQLIGSDDPELDMFLSLRLYHLFNSFGQFLGRASELESFAPVRNVLMQNASESLKTAKSHLKSCYTIRNQAPIASPSFRYCNGASEPSIETFLGWQQPLRRSPMHSDPKGPDYIKLQRQVFSNPKDSNSLLKLAALYMEGGYPHQAAATSHYGISLSQEQSEDFRAILGCALLKQGLLTDAKFHLMKASNYGGMKIKCMLEIRRMEESL